MIKQELIEISKIEDLKLIYFYSINNELKNKYYELKITYGDNLSMSYKYTDEYFDYFISKVVSVYKKEKNKNNIIFLNDFSKKIFDEILKKEDTHKIKQEIDLIDNRMSIFNTITNDLSLSIPYIKEILNNLFIAIYRDENIKVENFKGINNRRLCTLKNNDKVINIPLILSKSKEDLFNFRFSIVNKQAYNFFGKVAFLNEHTFSYIKDEVIEGKCSYKVRDDDCVKYINVKDETLYYDNETHFLNNIEQEIINQYLNLLGIRLFSKMKKTCENTYLLFDSVTTDSITNRRTINMVMYKDYIKMLYKSAYGLEKNNNFIILNEENELITIKLIEDKIIIEKAFIDGFITSGDYKKNYLNKYKYLLYNISKQNLMLANQFKEENIKKLELGGK